MFGKKQYQDIPFQKKKDMVELVNMANSPQVRGDAQVLFLLKRDGQISSETFQEIYPTYYSRCECLDRLRKSGHTIKKDVKPKIDSRKRLCWNIVTYYLA
jgi:hypothetical protein